jgi:hypothetical protein
MKLKIREIISSISYANIKDTGFKYPNILLKEFAKYIMLWHSPTKHAVGTLIGIPTITSISPSSGSITGSESISIIGTNFIYLLSVKIGASSADPYSLLDDTEIIATTPPGSVGTVTLSVTTESGVATTTFTYI